MQRPHRRPALRLTALAAGVALVATACWIPFDYGYGKGADISWIISEGYGGTVTWYVQGQAAPIFSVDETTGGSPIPGDWDDDGRTEPALSDFPGVVADGVTLTFPPQPPAVLPVGACGPSLAEVPGAWDGARGTEMGWFQHGAAEWQVEGQAPFVFGRPSTDADRCALYGTSDVPVPADYDGDGRTEAAVYQPDSGDWLVRGQPGVFANLGIGVGLPAPADYDGDGTDDPALFNHDNDDAAEGWQILGRPEVAVPGGAWPTVIRPWLVEHIIGLSYAEDVCSSAEPDPLCP